MTANNHSGRPGADRDPEPESFATRREVYRWLKAQGRWQVSERTVYNHAREGRLRPGKDGRYGRAAVEKYARLHLVELATGLKAGEALEALQETKLREEIALKREQREKLQRQREREEGLWTPTADLEMEIAARGAVLKTGLKYEVATRAGEWIALVGGEPARAAALEAAIWEALAARLDEYARTDEYQVIAPGEKANG